MRTIRYKDMLWAVAYQVGNDPDKGDFLTNQALSLATYINALIRRLWPLQDWPGWTRFVEAFPDASHMVGYENAGGPTVGGHAPYHIDRVFKVYLADPRVTDAPVETQHTLSDTGIHCGFDHGSSVWIKYIEPPPIGTAVEWSPDTTYAKGELTYRDVTGEVYKSKVNGNKGRDPALSNQPATHQPGFEPPPIPLPNETVTRLEAPDPGLAGQSKIMVLSFPIGTDIPPNPPPNNSIFGISISDVNGIVIGTANHFANGVETLDLIITDLANQLIADLPAFSILTDTQALTITLDNPSEFLVPQWAYSPVGGPGSNLPVTQTRAYIPAKSPNAGTKQTIRMPLTFEQVVPGGTYTLEFHDVAGVPHTAEYVALDQDNTDQILSGLITAIETAQATDDFFTGVFSKLDTVSPLIDFSTDTSVSLNSQVTLPGSPFWELVLFPVDLADMIQRGGYANVLKEQGQTDKGMAEEQIVPAEIQGKTATIMAPAFDSLTDQQAPRSRYRIT